MSQQKALHIVPKETCIMQTDKVINLRFSLDKTQLTDPSTLDHPLIMYHGPDSF
jgi:hypothetical protein